MRWEQVTGVQIMSTNYFLSTNMNVPLGLVLAILAAAVSFTSADAVQKKQPMPLFYGWFFNENIAKGLKNITDDHLRTLNSEVPSFQQFLQNVSSQTGVDDPLSYFTKPSDPNTGKFDPYYHITAYYCGKTDCSNYTQKVEQYLNQTFSTELVGVFFTPRTFGIRVNLSKIQEEIFGMGETKYIGDEVANNLNFFPNQIPRSDYPGIKFVNQDASNFHPTISRAHLTLGCAPNVSAVTTGLDLLEILELEERPQETFCNKIELAKHGNLIQMGKNCDIFVYYLNQKMVADATFEVYNSVSAKIPSGKLSCAILSVWVFINFLNL